MKTLNTPEEVAAFVNKIPVRVVCNDVDITGLSRDGVSWIQVTLKSTGEEVEYMLETVKKAVEMKLIRED